MICKICKSVEGRGVALSGNPPQLLWLKNLDGICFDCHESVPKHIPVEQVRKFLERKPK